MMKSYEFTYSTLAGGTIVIEAASEDEAINQFECMDIEELFEHKDLLRGIEIDNIEEI